MMKPLVSVTVAWIGAVAAVSSAVPAIAQIGRRQAPHASNVVLPQRSVFAWRGPVAARITAVDADVRILGQVATTRLDIALTNPGPTRIEAELIVPVPDGAVVRGFAFQGSGQEPTAELLAKDEARRLYESIVAKTRDPALLEFVGYGLVRSSVFPVEPRGTQRVRLTYEHLLRADGDRVDYVLPRTEALDYQVPWTIEVRMLSKGPLSAVYCPSHEVDVRRRNDGEWLVRLAPGAGDQPGPFRLSYLRQKDGVSASLLAYPDPAVSGGYFLLLMGLPAKPAPRAAIPREVTLVIDRSGSMNGEKIRQARESAFRVLGGLRPGESFNIIVYNEAVDLFAPNPTAKTQASLWAARRFLDDVQAQGGTNIHDALVEALRQKPSPGALPIVLFLTDGLPTVGQTSEAAIRRLATAGNPYRRRVFTLGIGTDVNVPLLDKIASETRGTPGYVLPGEDVEAKVAQIFRRLDGPVLADPVLEVVDAHRRPDPSRVQDRIPAALPDLFDGEQLVILGRYRGEEPLRFKLTGNYLGARRAFESALDVSRGTTRNAFVPRLWASRKIGLLIDAVRQLGADAGPLARSSARPDPRTGELIEEIVRLSLGHGILTEYTAFLAREGTDLGRREQLASAAADNLYRRAVATRVGPGASNQSANLQYLANQQTENRKNAYLDERLSRVDVAGVQQVNDRAFYQRRGRWVDSRLAARAAPPDRVVAVGSRELVELAERLARDNRQGCLALRGEILLEVDGRTVLVR